MTLYSRLAAYYPCDDTHGRSLSEDIVGTNNGTAGVASSATGKVRQGMFFLSSGSQFRSVPDDSAIQGLLGVCCWVKFSTLAADMSIVSKGSDGTDANTSIKLWYDHSDTDLALTVGDGSTSTTINTDGLTLAVDTWYHIRAYNDGNRMGIAVDGTLYGSGTARAPLTETGLLYLGSDFSNNYLDGVIDEVALFSTSPTIADGAALYNGGDGASLPIPDTLPGPSGRAGAGNRWLPPSFAESDDAVSYMAHGKLPVQRFDGTLSEAGVEAPDQKVTIASSGSGTLTGQRYAYLRNLDAEGRVSSVSPLSDVHDTFGSTGSAITGATNSAPIVVTSVTHGLATGDKIRITGQLGNTAANGTWTVTTVTGNTFSLNGSVGNGDWSASSTPGLKLTVTQEGSPGISQVQTLSYSNTPTAGSFILTFKGEPTAAIAYNASAATVQAALELLTGIDEDGVLCAGGALDVADVTVTFQNSMATVDHPVFAVDFTGAPSTLSATVTKIGTAGNNEVQTIDLVMLPTGGTFTLTYDGQTTGNIAYNASAATVETALEALSNLTSAQVSCSGGDLPGVNVVVEFTGDLAETDIDTMTIDGTNLTGAAISVSVSTTTPGVGPSAVWSFNSDFVDSVQGITLTATGSGFPEPAIDTGTKHLGAASLSGGGNYRHLAVTGLADGVLPKADEDFSVSLWLRRGGTWNNPSGGFEISDGLTGTISIILVTSGTIRVSKPGGTSLFASSVIPLNTWTHVVAVYDDSAETVTLYIDGSSSTSGSFTSPSSPPDASKISVLYNGMSATNVDEIAVWPIALSAANVTSLYNSGTGEEAPYTPETNEVQEVDITGSPVAGAFTLTYSGQTTAPLAYNATAAQVDTALENLSNIASGDVTCTGGPLPGTAIDVEFTGNLAGTNVAEMTATASSSPSVAISTPTAGVGVDQWNISNGLYSSKSFAFSSELSNPTALVMSADGDKMYATSGAELFQYTLSTPGDISTASYLGVSLWNGTESNGMEAWVFSPDGLSAYALANGSRTIFQYTLTTAWDLSTAAYASKSLNIATEELNPRGLAFSSDGTKAYIVGFTSFSVFQYTLTTAWDVSTGIYSSKNFVVDGEHRTSQALSFSSDGTKAFIYGSNGATYSPGVHQYSLSTPWDASTGSYDDKSLDASFEETGDAGGMAFSSDGSTVYVAGTGTEEAYQYSLSSGWDIGTASYDSVTRVVSAQMTNPSGMVFKTDGKVMYVLGLTNARAYQYTLTTAWDLSTSSYSGLWLNVFDEDTAPSGIAIGSRGTKAYISGGTNVKVFQYTMSTAWNIMSGDYDTKSLDVSSEDSAPKGIALSADGTKVYVVGATSGAIFQYTLTTAWDLSTGSYASKSLDVSNEDATPSGISMKSDGTKAYITGTTNDSVYQYNLSTAWDISTGTYASKVLDVSSEETVPTGITLNVNGTKAYVVGSATDTVYQYSVSSGGTNEVQRITVSGSPASGSLTLTYSGQTTGDIAYNATAAVVDTALEALSNIAAGDVSCTGGPLPDSVVDVEFTGNLAQTNVDAMTASANGFMGTITTTTGGSKSTNEEVSLSTDVPAGTGTFTLTFGGQTTVSLAYDATAAEIQTAFTALSTVGVGNASVSAGPINTTAVVVEFGGVLSTQDVGAITATSSMTQTSPVLNATVSTAGTAGQNEIQQISVDGVTGGTWTATYDSVTSAAIAFDATASETQQALEAVSTIDNANVLVTGGPLNSAPFSVEFLGTLGTTNVESLALTSTALVNGGWSQGAYKLTYSNVALPSSTNVTRRQILRSKPGSVNLLYIDVDEEDVVSTEFSSTNTDDDLLAADAIVLLDANGVDTNLSRHGVPPNWKRSIASFNNRLFFGVDYVERPVVTVSGDTATGVGTDWPNVFDDRMLYEDSGKALAAFDANNQTAALSESTATDQTAETATVRKEQPDSQRVYHSWVNAIDSFPESVHPGQTFQISRDTLDGEMTGQFSFGGRFYTAFEHSLYEYAFNNDPAAAPNGDGRMQKASPRGLINQQCVAFSDDFAYLLDRDGCYSFDGNSVTPLSEVIKPIFTGRGERRINWARQQWFFSEYFPQQRTVRLFVVLDGGPYPKHALCHNVDQGYWWIEQYPFPITSSTRGSVNGKTEIFLGSTGRRIFTLSGSLEGAISSTSTLQGTATSAGCLTLSDSSATYGSELVNVPLRIVDGTGYGQERIVVSVSGTTLTVDQPWNKVPSTDSVYQLGGIHWTMKTGKLRFTQNNTQEKRRVEVLYEPLTRAQQLSYRLFLDWSDVAVEAEVTFDGTDTDGVAATAGSDRFEVDLTGRGHAELDFDGIRQEGSSGGDKFVSVELSGTTNKEEQRLHGIAVSGAE